MKKIFISLAVVVALVLSVLPTLAYSQATVFNPLTGERKVVDVGDPNAFNGGWILETKEVDYISYWVNRLINENAKPITDEDIKSYGDQARYILRSEAFNNEVSRLNAEFAEWAAKESFDYEGVVAMRHQISGINLLKERLSEIPDIITKEKENNEPYKGI